MEDFELMDQKAPAEDGAEGMQVRVITGIGHIPGQSQVATDARGGRTCAYHPTLPASYICTRCSKPLCHSCAQQEGSFTFCPQCRAPAGFAAAPAGGGTPKTPGMPFGYLMGLLGGIFLIIGFFMPWASLGYREFDFYMPAGGDIQTTSHEILLLVVLGGLIMTFSVILMAFKSAVFLKTMVPFWFQAVPGVLGIICLVILVEFSLGDATFLEYSNIGWFLSVLGAGLATISTFGAVIQEEPKASAGA